MDKQDLKRMAEDPNYIPGIYNYCNRWCERCPFTARCMNFAMGEEYFPDQEARDINNAAFWDQMHEMFEATLGLIREMAEEAGLDLDALEVDEEWAAHEEQMQEDARNHPLARAAEAYTEQAIAWYEGAHDLFQEKEDALNRTVRLGLAEARPEEEAAAILDAVEVIHWYQYQIHVKILRALHGDMEEPLEILAGMPRDADGSAKVALIGIDHSIAAWRTLWTHFPDQEDAFLPILVHLERLRRNLEAAFPDARAFFRPGFDGMPPEDEFEDGFEDDFADDFGDWLEDE